MITQLAHVCLFVSDIQQTLDFYHGKLGLPLKFTFEKEGKLFGVYFSLGGRTFLEAFQVRDGKVPVVNTGLSHFCMEVEDLDAFMAAMKAKGVACTDKVLGCDQSWQTWLQDPDGNRFEMHQYTAQSTQFLGGVVQTAGW